MKGKITLPNLLAVVGALVVAVSLLYPWWSLEIQIIGKTYIYPYIIRGPATEIIGYRRTSQMPLLTAALVACVVLGLLGSVLSKRAARVVLLLTVVLSSLATWRFYVRAADVASRYHMSVQGSSVARLMAFSPLRVAGKLEPGFYLNIAGAALLLLAAILHGKLRPDRVAGQQETASLAEGTEQHNS